MVILRVLGWCIVAGWVVSLAWLVWAWLDYQRKGEYDA